MRVRVLEACTPYWNYQVHNLTAGAEVVGEFAGYLATTGAPVEALDSTSEPDLPSGVLDIDGSAAEILAWVGELPERATEALEAEVAKDKPRSTLVKALEKLAGQD